IAGLLLAADVGFAQCGFGRFPSVGGISINPEGVLSEPPADAVPELVRQELKNAKPVAGALSEKVTIRKISLKAIEAALAKSEQNNAAELPQEIKFLAGIQRIQYVLVYPDDIVLAGPGEGWKLDSRGNYVGVTTGRPVVRLEDLVVALRTVNDAREGAISVSIDPTEEGRKRFESYMKSQKTFTPAVLDGIAQALGNQTIKIRGVPETSRFARMLAASDYKMKRIAMKLEESPLPELPSFLDMMKKGGAKLGNMMPRWWMACNYEPLAKSEDGLAWEIRGQGVKVLTEDDYVAGGKATATGKVNPLAKEWADTMTKHYDKLAVKEPVFGDLRNLMDLCVVAALIQKEGLQQKANLQLPTLQGQDSKFELVYWHAPKTVATQCSFVKRGSEYIITASGGVEIASWEVAGKSILNAEVGQVRSKATPQTAGSLWWN
ncbi:MAG TPA: DUF1598 domain-containing protein, partial [Pirellulaceae bacterium]|nr:DUF1598 domain-containing protein [Pirellulaceae bacterium]